MRILADENVPEEYVSALRGDGHEVDYSRAIEELGRGVRDEALVSYAADHGISILSTDVKDFGDRSAEVAILVAPQDMSGRAVRAAVARIESLPIDTATAPPLWLSSF